MDDREFFDLLYQQWSKTYGAQNMYWMYEEVTNGPDTLYEVYAVDAEQEKHFIATFEGEADAEFITAVHGCFGDLVRRLHAALDESDRADHDRDSRECRIAELEMEVAELRAELGRSEDKRPDRLEDHG